MSTDLDSLLLGHIIDDCPVCDDEDVKVYPTHGREDDFDGESGTCWECYKEVEGL